jgi:hypothetical protein
MDGRKDSNSDKCRNREKCRHRMGHWIAPTSKKRETGPNSRGKGAADQNREINEKTVRNCSTSSTKKQAYKKGELTCRP